MKNKTSHQHLAVLVTSTLFSGLSHAAVSYTNDFQSGLGAETSIVGDFLYGGAGAEDQATQPGGANGDRWAYFQLGTEGPGVSADSGIVIDMGTAALLSDGNQIHYRFVLGNKSGQTFTENFSLRFFDGSPTIDGEGNETSGASQVGATVTISPVSYDELYAGGAGNEIRNISGSITLDGDTSSNLHAVFFFDSDASVFKQALLDDISITQSVPEPASAAMLVLGGITLIFRRSK